MPEDLQLGLVGEVARLAGDSPVGSHHLLAALSDPNTAAARTRSGLGLDLEAARNALRQANITGTSGELPEERGRRHMVLRVADRRLTVETTGPALVELAQAAADGEDAARGRTARWTSPARLASCRSRRRGRAAR